MADQSLPPRSSGRPGHGVPSCFVGRSGQPNQLTGEPSRKRDHESKDPRLFPSLLCLYFNTYPFLLGAFPEHYSRPAYGSLAQVIGDSSQRVPSGIRGGNLTLYQQQVAALHLKSFLSFRGGRVAQGICCRRNPADAGKATATIRRRPCCP